MKEYKIFLDDILIGTTNFEFADVPMGVVFGKVNFIDIENPYLFIKSYYLKNKTYFEHDDCEEFLTSQIQRFIKVYKDNNEELIGWGAYLSGLKDDFQIDFMGIESDLMLAEFPHHVKQYYGETD